MVGGLNLGTCGLSQLQVKKMKGLRGKPQFDEEDEMHPAFDDDEEEEEEEEDDE